MLQHFNVVLNVYLGSISVCGRLLLRPRLAGFGQMDAMRADAKSGSGDWLDRFSY